MFPSSWAVLNSMHNDFGVKGAYVLDVHNGDKVSRFITFQVNKLNLAIMEDRENSVTGYEISP
jgi:hypothetical protein